MKAHQLRHFDKYDFIKSFVATASILDSKHKEEKEREAELIANAIEETQIVLFDNLATKKDLEELRLATKKDLEELRLATKKDLEELRLATKKDLQEFSLITKQDLAIMRQDLKLLENEFKKDLQIMRQDLKLLENEFKKDLQYGLVALEQKLTIKLAAIIAALLTFLPLVTEFLKKLF
jgi:transposase